MEFSLRALGVVNGNVPNASTVLPRFVATITAEQLSSLILFDRAGRRKADRYRLRPESFVQIDKEIQRGRDTADNLLQVPSKVEDIALTLLGGSKSISPVAYLGTLIWNVRSEGVNGVTLIEEKEIGGGLPSYKLRVKADHVWLTDSAHRHLGIAEAYRRFSANPTKYPKFRSDYEFVVEIYRLDRAGEKSLFYELNALQKRITAAKRKEMDVISSEGYVKDVVRQYDEASRRLFDENIEVTAIQNVNHTLMTMSVFVSSMHEMFSRPELTEAKEDPQKRAELAEYYCDFFYKLHDTLRIMIDDETAPNGKRELTPYYNLYQEIIQPAINAVEADTEQTLDKKLEEARETAKALNARVRGQDIANHNATIKALCRIGRLIRYMPRWERVIDYLQMNLNLPAEGRFFQKANAELLASPTGPSDVQIAKLNENGTLNVQVQTQTINMLFRYLRSKLKLDLGADLRLVPPDAEAEPVRLSAPSETPPAWSVSRADGGAIEIEAAFFLAGQESPELDTVKLAVAAPAISGWKELQLTGARKLVPSAIQRDEAYAHPVYENDISRFVATFTLSIPPAPKGTPSSLLLELRLVAPDLDPISSAETERRLTVSLT